MKTLRRVLLGALALLLAGVVTLLVLFWAPDKSVDELKQRWAQPPSQFITVMGMQVHVRDEGPRTDPIPIVLLHGTSASLHTWDGWAQGLRNTRRVIRFDLPAFGLTGPHPTGDYSVLMYVRFVVAVLDTMGVRNFVIAGNSLGGQIAWSVAAVMPERVSKLVLEDAGGYPFESKSLPIGFMLARTPGLRVLLEYILPRAMVEKSIRNVYGNPDRVSPALVDLYMDMTLRAGNRRALGQRMDERISGNLAQISALRVPTLILWGSEDRLIPPDNAQRFAQDIVGSELVIFEGLGHVPHEEDPATTLVPVARFLGVPLQP
jgi:pimeloyl-ACP methyl ester carboxylesterase